jgi:hypothetical protein
MNHPPQQPTWWLFAFAVFATVFVCMMVAAGIAVALAL